MGKTPNLTALTAQLAEMQATLGRLAGPAEGSGNPPSAGEVSLYDFWLKHMDGKKPPKLNEQYRTALAHLNNRVRNCDDCGTVIIPLKRKHRREKTEFMQRRTCLLCSGSTQCTPVASELTVNLLTAWVSQLLSDGYSAATSRRLLTQIRAILNAMVDAGENIRPPRRMVDLPRSRRSIRLVSETDIGAVYRATSVARQWDPQWWKTLLCGMVLYGFRPSEITSIQWKGEKRHDLREGIYWGKKPPHDELRDADIVNPHGWLVYLPGKQAKVKPDPLILPLSRVFREHLLATRKLTNGTGQILPVTTDRGDYTLDEDAFRAEFKRIKQAANVTKPWTFRDLRRNCESRFARQFTSDDAKALTGHARRDVSGQSYLDLVLRLVDEVDRFTLTQLFEG
jgi:integrase